MKGTDGSSLRMIMVQGLEGPVRVKKVIGWGTGVVEYSVEILGLWLNYQILID